MKQLLSAQEAKFAVAPEFVGLAAAENRMDKVLPEAPEFAQVVEKAVAMRMAEE